jgi:hypothetical protein
LPLHLGIFPPTSLVPLSRFLSCIPILLPSSLGWLLALCTPVLSLPLVLYAFVLFLLHLLCVPSLIWL